MYLEIITPDENVFEGEVESAMFPGSDGSFQVLNDHAPLVSSVGKGDVKIIKLHDKKTEEIHFSIDGGVVEVLNNKILVLAESIGE
ncbi:MAG: ATP synthase F1 subunit epsilon [Reichenbachiella sp.]|uniref:ATP synthase F1 subunit epsilon n=1 Tax=Reichenbachiella sp. TaxID=2184521 RepID=UPI003297C0BC